VTDPDYVAKLVAATRIADPKRVEIHFKADFSIIVEARDLPGLVQMEPSKESLTTARDENSEARDLIDWFRRYRIEKGISFEDLAKQIGISKGTLMAYFDGKRVPSQITLGRIQKFKKSTEPEQ